MKLSELKCPWPNCTKGYNVYKIQDNFYDAWRYKVSHDCLFFKRIIIGPESKTRQGAMNNWNSWITPTQRKLVE